MASGLSNIGSGGGQSFCRSCQVREILGQTRPLHSFYDVSVEEGTKLITSESKPEDKGGDHFGLEGDPHDWVKLGTLSNPNLEGEEGTVGVFFKKKSKSTEKEGKKTEWAALPALQGPIPSLYRSLMTQIRIDLIPKKAGTDIKYFVFPLTQQLRIIEIEPTSQCGSRTGLKRVTHEQPDGVKEVASLSLNKRTYNIFQVSILQKAPEVTQGDRPSWSGWFWWLGYKLLEVANP